MQEKTFHFKFKGLILWLFEICRSEFFHSSRNYLLKTAYTVWNDGALGMDREAKLSPQTDKQGLLYLSHWVLSRNRDLQVHEQDRLRSGWLWIWGSDSRLHTTLSQCHHPHFSCVLKQVIESIVLKGLDHPYDAFLSDSWSPHSKSSPGGNPNSAYIFPMMWSS